MSITKYNSFEGYVYDQEVERKFASCEFMFKQFGEVRFRIEAFFINTKGKFGDAPVCYTPEFIVNLPQHMLNIVKDIMQDQEVTDQVNKGEAKIYFYEYQSKKYGTKYGARFE